MKNIHILPTNDKSKIIEGFGELKFYRVPDGTYESKNKHIYITSDEEIISLSEINLLPLSDGKDIQTNMSNI